MSSSIFLSQALPTGYKLEETLELHIKLWNEIMCKWIK
jgi:hypothetical protein